MPIARRRSLRSRNNPDRFIRDRIAQITEARLREHLKHLVGVRHHEAAPEVLEAAGDYITKQFRTAGLVVRNHWFEAFGHRNRNIIGSTRGRPGRHFHRRPPLILGAHYDTVARSPGADDNASGVAVMLEAARVLGGLVPPLPLIFVGFAQEEQHCLGSTLYAIKQRRAGIPLRGMISLECVGCASSRPGSQENIKGLPINLPDTGNFLGVVGNLEAAGLKDGFEKTAKQYVSDLPLIGLLVPDAGHGFPDTRRSDHSPFWDAGYPAMMMTDTANFRNPAYHQPGDILKSLNLTYMTNVARSVVAFLIDEGMREERYAVQIE